MLIKQSYLYHTLKNRAELIIGSSICLPLNLEHQYPLMEREYLTCLHLIIRTRMTNHSKAGFEICKEIEDRYKITCT